MNQITASTLPTTARLVRATCMALAVAGMILVTVVLPAELGIDPTGAGKAMGLTTMRAPAPAAAPAGAAVSPVATSDDKRVPVTRNTTPLQTGEMSLTLPPGQGAEIKASMRKDQQFVFDWATTDGQVVEVDMHGEPPNAGDTFSSYWKDLQRSSAQGAFVAPFDGTHGWYWQNNGTKPVTVRVKVSGFYEKLFKP